MKKLNKQKFRFKRNLEHVLSEISEKPTRPGEQFSVEAEVLDIYIICRGTAVRPTFYLVCDDFTRMVMGGLVSLEKPNPETARLALFSCFEDQAEICRQFGLNIEDDDWPRAAALPSVIRGDFIRENGKLSQELGITAILSKPGFRPVSSCEKVFGKLNRALERFGARPGNDSQRCVAPTLPNLSLKSVKAIFALTVAEHNRHALAGRPDGLSACLTADSPAYLQNHADRAFLNRLRSTLLPEVLKARWISTTGLRVSNRGITDLFYCPPPAVLPKFLLKPQSKLQVLFDPRVMDTVWVSIRGTEPLIAFSLAPRSQAYCGMSWAEGELEQRRKLIARSQARPEAPDAR